jgi:outer membrane protein assembly factor BamB
MKARAVLLVFLCSTLGVSALAQDAAGVMQSVAHPWQMRNATPARTGQSASVGAGVGQLDWRFPIAGYVPQIAVAQDGSIYLGTVFNENAWNNESYAYALTSAGGLKWREKVTSYEWGASQGTSGGPAVDDAGNVLIPSTNTALVKLSSEGDPMWIHQGNPQAVIQGSPAVLPDQTIRHTIFPAGLLAMDSAGTILFTGSPAPQNAGATVSVSANGDMAVSGVRTSEPHGSVDIQYFNADGTRRWQKTSSNGASGTPVFGPDGIVYAPFLGKAFFPDGTVKWTTDVLAFTAALGNNGVLYFPNSGVVAVDAATGTRLWTVPIPGLVLKDPAVDALGNVFVTTVDGKLWSVSPTGGINWSLQVCDKFLTGPVVAAGGRIVAAGMTGYQKFVFAVR